MTAISHDRPIDQSVEIAAGSTSIDGDWTVPLRPRGTVIITNGAGCSRFARRNRDVARRLYDDGFATLLVDLLSHDEEQEDALTGALRLDVDMLAERITAATEWVKDETEVAHLPVGHLASGVASAAALVADVQSPGQIDAIASRGGRPDLASIRLYKVAPPVLLIAGSADSQNLELNRWALRRLNCEKSLVTVPNATSRFEEPGTFAAMTDLAASWFKRVMKLPRPAANLSIFSMSWTERKLGVLTP
ncbi:MAG: dienelactone hydrolase family protein [Gemmatimonadaceae bacterium]